MQPNRSSSGNLSTHVWNDVWNRLLITVLFVIPKTSSGEDVWWYIPVFWCSSYEDALYVTWNEVHNLMFRKKQATVCMVCYHLCKNGRKKIWIVFTCMNYLQKEIQKLFLLCASRKGSSITGVEVKKSFLLYTPYTFCVMWMYYQF